MRIAGLQKLTLVDFPGRVAATVFTQGCNFRCGFCHNPELAIPSLFQEPLITEVVLHFLESRRGKLDGVVISGGEPTLQKGLVDFIFRIKSMDFAVKLDTNGSHPEVIASLIDLEIIDYIAMDIKTTWAKYPMAAGIHCDTSKMRESVDLIINSGIPYQLRTTLVKEYCSQKDLKDIQDQIKGARHYVLQPFVLSPKIVDQGTNRLSQYTNSEIELLKAKNDVL